MSKCAIDKVLLYPKNESTKCEINKPVVESAQMVNGLAKRVINKCLFYKSYFGQTKTTLF